MEVIKTSTIDRLRSEASKELQEEFEKRAKERIKTKLRDLENSKKLTANLQRELEDLEIELSN